METVDAMTLNRAEAPGQLRVVRVLGNGKRWFDPVEKERLIDACLEPGVSVAGLALAHGINANQLRKWVKLRQDRKATETACRFWVAARHRPSFRWLRPRRWRGCRPRQLGR